MYEPESIKIVLIGESGVGKTSIISQFTTHKFDRYCQASLNSQFTTKIIDFPEYEQSLKLDIWDTVGQEQYRSLAKIFYKDAKVILFVYDITSIDSYNAIKNYWYNETQNYANKNPLLVLVANKDDLYEGEKISVKEGKKYADEINALFIRTSATSNMRVNLLFENIGKKLIDPEYDINVNHNNIGDDKLLKEINELKSIKSGTTNKTNRTNRTMKSNRTKQLDKNNEKIKIENDENNNINVKKKCC